jgi:DNA-binding beta-propeller fold protein YncE
MESPVYGLAVAVFATGSSVTHQLLVAETGALAIFDGLTEKQLGKIPMPNGPQYLSFPPGETVYVTTRQGTVDAVDIRTRTVNQLLTGGVFGQMDYDALTNEVYVPDEKHNLLAVLTPVFAGTALPKEPIRVIHTDAPPESVAITNDGQLGFTALRGGKVVMLDLLGRQIANTIDVGGTPHFVITGLYPPSTSITPPKAPVKQASTLEMVANNKLVIMASVLAFVLLVLALILMLRYRQTQKVGRQRRRPSRH